MIFTLLTVCMMNVRGNFAVFAQHKAFFTALGKAFDHVFHVPDVGKVASLSNMAYGHIKHGKKNESKIEEY